MVKIQFISVQTLKEKTVIQDNVNEKVLNIAIREFQEIELKRILKRDEYLRLEGELLKFQEGEITELEPGDVLLMEYVVPVMCYGALMYSIPAISTKFTDKGLQEDTDLNAEKGNRAEARADYGFKLDSAKRSLIEYMNEARENPTHCGTIEDTTFNFTGVALPDTSIDYEAQYRKDYYKAGGGRRVI